TQTFTFDACTNGQGRLCKVADPHGELTYTYDPQGRVLTQGQRIGSSSVSFGQAYVYDPQGRLAGIGYPGNVSVGYGYTAGRVTAMSVKIGSTTHSVATDIRYRPYGPMTGWTYGNGLTRAYAFDEGYAAGDERLTSLLTLNGSTPVQGLTYAYDKMNRITRIANAVNT